MSTLTAPARSGSSSESREAPPPRLRILPAPTSGPRRAPYVAVLALVAVAGLVALLLLHTFAAQDSFRASAMRSSLARLDDQRQQLRLQLQHDGSPARLRARALQLGMRPSSVTRYRRLPDGRVVGMLAAVPPPPAAVTPTPAPSSTPSVSPSPSASASRPPATTPASSSSSSSSSSARRGGSPGRR